MKQFKDYNKQLLRFVLIGILSFVPIFFSFAQSANELNELRDKINEKTADIEKLEKEIKGYQSELVSLGKEKQSLSGAIKQLDLTRKKLVTDIALTEKKIEKTNLTIQGLSSQINIKEDSIATAEEAIAIQIRQTHELEEESFVVKVLSQEDFTEVWNDVDHMLTVREKIRENIALLRETKVELEDTRTETIAAKNELTSLKAKLADQKKIVDQNTAEKKKLLAQTQNSEANYQKILVSQTALKNQLEQEVAQYESQLRFILDPSSLPGRVLDWPLSSILVTSPFGPRWGRMHTGTDFRAAVGTPVKAVAKGKVLGVGNTDLTCPKASFGQWILVKHNNGLSSVYAHLSLIKVEAGASVESGQIIAYSGNSGSSTGPHLHLGVYSSQDAEGNPGVQVKTILSKSCAGKTLTQPIAATNAYLDPMNHLPPYKQ